ncbi:MAG: signal recognition particle-docking protein FtsY [Oculatellaceae cyanobacterium bins.114]|nr:signal recognition particle-docking protein FtsY [Oculatellaceae cyanobacterium bins.114]
MSFNWFNRPQNPSSDAKSESTPSPESASAQPEASVDLSSTSEPAIDSDSLAWAKAAYKNIQKRQAEAATTDSASTAASPEEAPPAPVETGEVASTMDAVATPTAAEVVEPISVTAPEPEVAAATVETPISETTAPSEPETAAVALPFWAQAEAERQERLERLKAEAIAEPEPETRQTSTTTAAAIPELPLDENFVWSAQVLAAQGRRPDQVDIEEITWLKRLRQSLDKTRRSLINQLRAIVGQGPLNQDAVLEIEALLLQADVGVEATDFIIESLQQRLRQEVLPPEQAIAYLKEILRGMLDNPGGKPYDPTFAPEKDTLNIWLITGVNGAGKTTTIGKLAHIAQKSGYQCLIGAADTFRAAAVQQVKVWGDRSNVEVIANPGKNTDPAAVVFDAITAAQARNTELLLIDTAGRLQNKKNLMDELSKIRRIIDKKAPNAHIESLLVLDATLGQNGLRQAEVFSEAAQLSGVVLTKLDGTAKGGIALAVVQQLGLPIRFIGAGEGIEDLRPFSSYEFVEALLSG